MAKHPARGLLKTSMPSEQQQEQERLSTDEELREDPQAKVEQKVQWGSGELLAKQQRSGQVRFGPIHTVMPPCTVVFGLQTLAAVSIASRLSALSVRS